MPKATAWLEVKKGEIMERYGDAKNFATIFNPSMQVVCAMNIERALRGDAPTIKQLIHAYQVSQIEVWLMAQLHDLNDYAGVKTKMDSMQMKNLAHMLITKALYLKASEILLFFHKLKGGDFGVFYGTVDPQKVGENMNEFMKWRSVQLDRIIYIETQQELERKRAEWKKNAITREEFDRRQAEKNKKRK